MFPCELETELVSEMLSVLSDDDEKTDKVGRGRDLNVHMMTQMFRCASSRVVSYMCLCYPQMAIDLCLTHLKPSNNPRYLPMRLYLCQGSVT